MEGNCESCTDQLLRLRWVGSVAWVLRNEELCDFVSVT